MSTIREAIRAYIEEQGTALDVEWLQDHAQECIDEELGAAGFVFDDEQCEWIAPQDPNRDEKGNWIGATPNENGWTP